jgi:hypothetical protein
VALIRVKRREIEGIPYKSTTVSFYFFIVFSGHLLWTCTNGIIMDSILGSYMCKLYVGIVIQAYFVSRKPISVPPIH